MDPEDYSIFRAFFNPVIRHYHGDTTGAKKHTTSWETSDESFDVSEFGSDKLSMRVRVGRNLVGHKLPGAMTKECRVIFENKMLPVFDKLIKKYGGKVYSLSPDLGEDTANPNLITEGTYQELVDSHIMFKDMSSDSFLKSAGISNDWPYGRGCWQSEDRMRVIWFGEEDQLRIMCMKESVDIKEIFTSLKEMLDTIESLDDIEFAKHEDYGYITSCPSNLGTGMRASVHIKAPALVMDGTDVLLKELCAPLGLSVRGTGGEHTPIVDCTVDISPSSRLFVSEGDIISSLYAGAKHIDSVEKKVAHFLQMKDSQIKNKVKNAPIKAGDNETVSTFVASTKGFVILSSDTTVEDEEQAEKIKNMKDQMKAIKTSTSNSSRSVMEPVEA